MNDESTADTVRCGDCGRGQQGYVILETLPIGARVRLADGECGTITVSNFTRVRVKLDRKRTREFWVRDQAAPGGERRIEASSTVHRDIAPAAEVETLATKG